MKYIKEHKKLTLIIAIVVVVLCLLLILIHALFPDSSKSKWGSRLDDIASHQIADDEIDKVSNALKSSNLVSEVSTHINGRTFNFLITVNDNVKREKAEELAPIILENLSEDIKEYYDLEIYFKGDGEEYPFMAYKNKTKSEFSFTYAG